jgi:hypothetical protein
LARYSSDRRSMRVPSVSTSLPSAADGGGRP